MYCTGRNFTFEAQANLVKTNKEGAEVINNWVNCIQNYLLDHPGKAAMLKRRDTVYEKQQKKILEKVREAGEKM